MTGWPLAVVLVAAFVSGLVVGACFCWAAAVQLLPNPDHRVAAGELDFSWDDPRRA